MIENPHRGFFDFYSTRLWPVAIVLLLVGGGISSAMKGPVGTVTTAPLGNGSSVIAPVGPIGATGTAHTCWYTGDELNGCRDDTSSAMLFGSQFGTQTTCWFVEPLGDGAYASCP